MYIVCDLVIELWYHRVVSVYSVWMLQDAECFHCSCCVLLLHSPYIPSLHLLVCASLAFLVNNSNEIIQSLSAIGRVQMCILVETGTNTDSWHWASKMFNGPRIFLKTKKIDTASCNFSSFWDWIRTAEWLRNTLYEGQFLNACASWCCIIEEFPMEILKEISEPGIFQIYFHGKLLDNITPRCTHFQNLPFIQDIPEAFSCPYLVSDKAKHLDK